MIKKFDKYYESKHSDTPITNLRNLMGPIVNYFQMSEIPDPDEKLLEFLEKERKQCLKNMTRIKEILSQIPDDACGITSLPNNE